MYEIKKQERLRRIVRAVKRVARMPAARDMTGIRELFVETPVGKVRTLCFGMEDTDAKPVFFDIHGGGFVLGNADMDIPICRYLNRQAGCRVVSIEYSKAPEHPFPQAVNEVYETVQYFWEHHAQYGIDVSRMGIGGHSAGGNLAAVTCLRSLREKEFSFVGQILDYPPLDLSIDPHEKPRPKGAIKPGIAAAFDACYLPDSSAETNPDVSPVYCAKEDLRGLPAALIIVAGHDSLRDEAVRYYHLLKEAGVSAELSEYPEAEHGFTLQDSEDTRAALREMAEFLTKQFGA